MNTKINTLLGAVLSLLSTFGLAQSVSAQTPPRIALTAPVTDRKSGQTTYQIFSVAADGADSIQLTRNGGNFPQWSQTQRYLAFHRGGAIYIMDTTKPENKGGRIFATVNALGTGHDLSHDDSKLLFTGPSGAGGGLWMVNVNLATGATGTPVLIKEGQLTAPKFSPDNSKIVYVRSGAVKVLDLATGTEIALPGSSGPSWSPDGLKIAFGGVVCYGSAADCHQEVMISNADGTSLTQITALRSYSSFPVWSKDGTTLLFYSQVSGSKASYKTVIGSGVITAFFNGSQEDLEWNP